MSRLIHIRNALMMGGATVYATWNPADFNAGYTLSVGNLVATHTAATALIAGRSTIGKSSGKWYWEYKQTVLFNASGTQGIGNSTMSLNSYVGSDANGWGYNGSAGGKWTNAVETAYGATFAQGDVIGIALDMDAGTVTFYKNNVSQGQAFSGLSGTIYAALCLNTQNDAVTANFGATALTYTPPTGYNAGLYS